MTYVIPEIGVSYDLEYFEKYKAGIRVTFNPNDRKFSVKADSRIPQKKVHEFMLSKAPLFEKWLNKREEKTPITLPSDSRSPAFKKKLLDRCEELLKYYDGPRAVQYKVSYSKSYWGRCTNEHVISISAYCSYLTDDQLFYVLVHEHAHLIHMHHKPAFWNLVELYCPNYKKLRCELKGYTLN